MKIQFEGDGKKIVQVLAAIGVVVAMIVCWSSFGRDAYENARTEARVEAQRKTVEAQRKAAEASEKEYRDAEAERETPVYENMIDEAVESFEEKAYQLSKDVDAFNTLPNGDYAIRTFLSALQDSRTTLWLAANAEFERIAGESYRDLFNLVYKSTYLTDAEITAKRLEPEYAGLLREWLDNGGGGPTAGHRALAEKLGPKYAGLLQEWAEANWTELQKVVEAKGNHTFKPYGEK